MNENKTIASMTMSEFLEQLSELGIVMKQETEEKKYLSGVKELAIFLNCSISTAQRKISDHEFDYCLYRSGHILLFDKKKLLEGMKAGKITIRKFRNTNKQI
jgi:hypothetical protein